MDILRTHRERKAADVMFEALQLIADAPLDHPDGSRDGMKKIARAALAKARGEL